MASRCDWGRARVVMVVGKRDKIVAPLFFAVGAIVGIWSAVRSQILYRKLIDSFPPQFQDDLTSRYAFSVYALDPSTPLSEQAEYMNCQYAGCASILCVSLGFFSLGHVAPGCVVLLGFLLAAFTTFKSWKIYRENCDRKRG